MQKKNLWEEIRDSSKQTNKVKMFPSCFQCLKASAPEPKFFLFLQASAASKKYKFVVTGHGKYEKMAVEDDVAKSGESLYRKLKKTMFELITFYAFLINGDNVFKFYLLLQDCFFAPSFSFFLICRKLYKLLKIKLKNKDLLNQFKIFCFLIVCDFLYYIRMIKNCNTLKMVLKNVMINLNLSVE